MRLPLCSCAGLARGVAPAVAFVVAAQNPVHHLLPALAFLPLLQLPATILALAPLALILLALALALLALALAPTAHRGARKEVLLWRATLLSCVLAEKPYYSSHGGAPWGRGHSARISALISARARVGVVRAAGRRSCAGRGRARGTGGRRA